jgi:hypothetical protein
MRLCWFWNRENDITNCNEIAITILEEVMTSFFMIGADATHDYEVNLKAELEIMALHQKMDALREHQWEELITMQKEQLRLLTLLMEELQVVRQAGK